MGVFAIEPPYAGQGGSIFGTSRVAGALAAPFRNRGTVLMVADRLDITHKFYVESRHHMGRGARGSSHCLGKGTVAARSMRV
jgi:hypothetical protein